MKSKERGYGGASTTTSVLQCPQCERGVLFDRQCARLCERCGYVEGCEDSFVPNQANPAEEVVPFG